MAAIVVLTAGYAECHSFHQGHGQAFGEARQYEDVCFGDLGQRCVMGKRTEEVNAILNVVSGAKGLKLGALGAVAD